MPATDRPQATFVARWVLLVAVIAGLYFTVSSTNDPHYRDRFYEPLLHDVAVSLAVRRVYLERWPGER